MYELLNQNKFAQPGANDTVWRYMDLARFISILEESVLFFSQAKLMADKWEGAWGGRPTTGDVEELKFLRERGREEIYLNCWNVSEYESAAMWDIYQREGRGVAIRSTWGRLTESITSSWDIHGGKVLYVDVAKVPVADGNIYTPFMHKRVSFAHENEARLMLWDLEEAGPLDDRFNLEVQSQRTNGSFHGPGFKVRIDVEVLIESVYVAPDLPEWIGALIVQVVTRYGHKFPVIQSDLSTSPIL